MDATSSVVSPKQRKSIPSINRPNYVEYEGNVYHIARFLSLQVMKQYTPMASRKERWRAANMTDYFDRINSIVGDIHAGDFLYFSLNKPSVVKLGKIERISKRLSAKSAIVLLEGQARELNKLQFFVRLSEENERFSLSKEICLVKGGDVLKLFREGPNAQYLQEAVEIAKLIPQHSSEAASLSDMEPEEMTVSLLKKVLNKASIPFQPRERKSALLEKVKALTR